MVIVDLVEQVGRAAAGTVTRVRLRRAQDVEIATAWCKRTGNTLLDATADFVEIYRGRLSDDVDDLPEHRRPGYRLWIYTNFHCNLACDYCCVRSSPTARRRELDVEAIGRLADEARLAGVRDLYLTGGEPFMRTDIAEVASACARAAPTTILTNAMLFRGPRLDSLRAMPRDGMTLQISLDGARDVHNAHRGTGSFDSACDGIRTALTEGFRVRVAATLAADGLGAEITLHEVLDELGVPPGDRLVRRIARRGFAEDGVVVRRESLIPEVTVTADGVFWHPVGADDVDMLVTTRTFPLADAIAAVREEYAGYRRAGDILASTFTCS